MTLYSTTDQFLANPREVQQATGWEEILGANDRWTSVASEPEESPEFSGLRARIHYGEEEGCWIAFYYDGQPIGSLSVVWGEPFEELPEAEPRGVEITRVVLEKVAALGGLEPSEVETIVAVAGACGESNMDLRHLVDDVVRLLRFPVAWA